MLMSSSSNTSSSCILVVVINRLLAYCRLGHGFCFHASLNDAVAVGPTNVITVVKRRRLWRVYLAAKENPKVVQQRDMGFTLPPLWTSSKSVGRWSLGLGCRSLKTWYAPALVAAAMQQNSRNPRSSFAAVVAPVAAKSPRSPTTSASTSSAALDASTATASATHLPPSPCSSSLCHDVLGIGRCPLSSRSPSLFSL
uniref:Uncharacterized protein n=1 Tax=Leersia perrieri TaxID=77586 RepID=A0A0D9XM73_9ORYZ